MFSGGRKNDTHNKEIGKAVSPGRCLNHIDDLRAYFFHFSSFVAQYGTNVGFSAENSEAGIPEDVGTIYIHPDPGRMLPVGIKSTVIIVPLPESYTEN